MATKKIKVAKQPAMADKEKTEHIAKVTLLPSVNAAAVVSEYAKAFGEQDVSVLAAELRPLMNDVNDGNLQHCEAMLVGQAYALQSIFVNLARRAVNQEYLKHYETYLRLALKAQNQSRMTLETLAALKKPPVVFAKQTNINHGNQQVNNGIPAPATHAGKTINQQNELLEAQHGERMDTGTAGATIGKNPAVATVE